MINVYFYAILILLYANSSIAKNAHPHKHIKSVLYLGEWVNIKQTTEHDCILLKKKIPKNESNNWDLKICQHSGTFDETLKRTNFLKIGSDWYATGSMDQHPAQFEKDRSGHILLETVNSPTCGIFQENTGFHAAGGQCYSSLVGCEGNYATLESSGIFTDFSALKKITRSIKRLNCKRDK